MREKKSELARGQREKTNSSHASNGGKRGDATGHPAEAIAAQAPLAGKLEVSAYSSSANERSIFTQESHVVALAAAGAFAPSFLEGWVNGGRQEAQLEKDLAAQAMDPTSSGKLTKLPTVLKDKSYLSESLEQLGLEVNRAHCDGKQAWIDLEDPECTYFQTVQVTKAPPVSKPAKAIAGETRTADRSDCRGPVLRDIGLGVKLLAQGMAGKRAVQLPNPRPREDREDPTEKDRSRTQTLILTPDRIPPRRI